jgi:coenzyme F420-reducing hydrogenase delta subunit
VKYVGELLEQIGLGEKRVKMVNVSAAMGVQFAQNAQEFFEDIIEVGPNPFRTDSTEIVEEETAI